RFGAVVAVSGEDDPRARKLLDGLGMEPLDPASFTWARFAAGLQARRAPIKTVLLAGKLVVGVGNIYASEVLFLSRIHPATPACDISAVKARRLFTAIGQVMAQAVELGGTTLRDFSNALGVNGHFQHAAQVYGRAGQACHACSQPIQLLRQGQRSSYYCPRCQKTP
nr:formamidopyrimidine-DNA glycosylase [Comamonas sp.]